MIKMERKSTTVTYVEQFKCIVYKIIEIYKYFFSLFMKILVK